MEMLELDGFAVPLARVTSIQFGLPTTKDLLAASVFETRQSVERQQQLLDARLGLPAPGDRCTSCGAASLEDCDGHFGHVLLPTPIFHPSHVSKLCKLLQKLCLNCCRLKKTPRLKENNVLEEHNERDCFNDLKTNVPDVSKALIKMQKIPPILSSHAKPEVVEKTLRWPCEVTKNSKSADKVDISSSLNAMSRNSNARRATSMVKKEHCDMSGYVVISDDEGVMDDRDTIIMAKPSKKHKKHLPYDQTSADLPIIDVGSDDDNSRPCESFGSGEEFKYSAVSGSTKLLKMISGVKQSNGQETDGISEKRQRKKSLIGCKYCGKCAGGDANYPKTRLKVISKFIRNDECIQSIQMEIPRKGEEVPSDYWNFLGNHFKSPADGIPRARSLLPVEALQILRKVPEGTIRKLGMDNAVARPEAFVLECIPVPPNCIRLSENMVHNTYSASRVGADAETQILRCILKKVASIKGARIGEPTYRASVIEFEQLQYLFSQYLRVKGAPKVAGNSEPKILRYRFISSKTYGSKWLNQLRGTVLGKSSNFSARNIITGDPCMEIDEIAVPTELSNNITIPEKVTPLNKEILQDYVDKAPLGMPCSGPLIIEQGGKAFDISMAKNRRVLEIGDSVHRRLRNGDRVFANRPPTLNKHALICLKVRLQTNNSFAINPLLCAPYEADFDGDALHVYIPQSIESRSETCELMSLDNQFTCSQGGQAIVSLTQDALLAAHLLTTGHTFFTKSQMCQMLMWKLPSSYERIPPAILKSPAGAFWTGKQVFSITLPVGLTYSSSDLDGVLIQDGDLLKTDGGSQWLKNFPDSLVSAISKHKGTLEALKHLSLAARLSQELFFLRGFSLGLLDFSGGDNGEVQNPIVKEAIQEAKHHIDRQWNLLNMINKQMEPTCSNTFLNLVITSLQKACLQIEQRMLDLLDPRSSLSAILKAGSKGSAAKLRQQVGCLGIQLHKGTQFIRMNQARHLLMTSSSHSVSSAIPGFIENSYLDGLSPIEFYFCTIPSREAAVKQGVDIRQPGMLFKNLMLFLRDITTSYDGTVRYNYNKQLIQFKYGGAKAHGRFQLLKTKDGLIQVYNTDESEHLRWKDSYMAGEAVGVLAATAIVQPAYQLLLDPPQLSDARGGSPLEILQDSLLSGYNSSMKDIDRTVILRVKRCNGQSGHWKEWNALKVRDHLRKITLEMLSQSAVIEFTEDISGEWSGSNIRKLPWLCHIQLKEDALRHYDITADEIVRLLKQTSNGKTNFSAMQPFFFCRRSCHIDVSSNVEINGPCLHVMYGIPEEFYLPGDNKWHMKLLESIRIQGLPYLMSMTIKGKSWLDSVHVVWEEKNDLSRVASNMLLRSQQHKDKRYCHGEPVVRVTINKEHCNKRGLAWRLIIMACIAVLDVLDLEHSMPASIQEIRDVMGIEAAYQAVLKRIALALRTTGTPVNQDHLKLVVDLMVHSGDVIGFTSGGLKEFSEHISMSAPFLQGSFQAPFKTFLSAAGRGARDDLQGIVPSAVWGKPLAVGTGGHFDLLWQRGKGDRLSHKQLDIHELVACFKSEMEQPWNLATHLDLMPEIIEHDYLDQPPDRTECFSPKVGNHSEQNMMNGTVCDDGWGAPGLVGENKVAGLMTNDKVCSDGWGAHASSDANNLSGRMAHDTVTGCDDGWGAPASFGANKVSGHMKNDTEDGDGWGAPASFGANNLSACMTKDKVCDDGWGALASFGANKVTSRMSDDPECGDGWGAPALLGANKEVSCRIPSPSHEYPRVCSPEFWSSQVQDSRMDMDQDVSKKSETGGSNRMAHSQSDSLGTQERWKRSAKFDVYDSKDDNSQQDVDEKKNKKAFTPTGANLVPLRPRIRPRKEHSVAAAGTADYCTTGFSDDPAVVDAFVKTVQTILHQRYEPGQNLSEEDMKLVLEYLLPHHPAYQEKLGCGADAIKVDFNPSFPTSRCFIILHPDGTTSDFSYHKCVTGYLEKNLASYLESYSTMHGPRKPDDVSQSNSLMDD